MGNLILLILGILVVILVTPFDWSRKNLKIVLRDVLLASIVSLVVYAILVYGIPKY